MVGSLAFVVDYDQLGLPVDSARAAAPRLASSPIYGLARSHFAGLQRTLDQLHSGTARLMVGGATMELVRALITTAGSEVTSACEASGHLLSLQVTKYVENHLTDPGLDAELIAAVHHISVRRLYNIWSAHDLTLAQWIIHQRLERARILLAERSPALTVNAIARRCGFTDVSHLCRRFRAAYGMSPREWGQLSRPAPQPPAGNRGITSPDECESSALPRTLVS
jgi:AraC-like DNA-binding protein